jgi:glycosyltransferase involved in cell wall biosynthesis
MNLLFLRGKLPLDFRPDRLEYDKIGQCEDMWTVLCERLSRSFDRTELWYYGAGKNVKKKSVTDKFVERWVNFSDLPDFVPDVIIARGGFKDYRVVCSRYPKAKKVYYGAGVRFKPEWGKWDLILVDSVKQQRKIPGSQLFIKPAADNLFKPFYGDKKYDVCFMANAPQAEIKQHKLAFDAIAITEISMLHLGLVDDKLKKWSKDSNVTFGGWHRRHKLPGLICQCRVGLVCSTPYDSCPRVLPEFLACGLPVVALGSMNFWHEMYVNDRTGLLVSESEIDIAIRTLLKVSLDVRAYYDEFLSVGVAAERLVSQINGVRYV